MMHGAWAALEGHDDAMRINVPLYLYRPYRSHQTVSATTVAVTMPAAAK